MLTFRKMQSEHLRYLIPQEAQKSEHAVLLASPAYCEAIDNGVGMSAWRDSVCVGAAGVLPIYNHKACAWAVLSQEAGRYMLPIVRQIRRSMAILPYRRIELTVRADFDQGREFARLIGMRLETPEPMRASGATGEDEYLYAMVK
jgi:hypothetical protein